VISIVRISNLIPILFCRPNLSPLFSFSGPRHYFPRLEPILRSRPGFSCLHFARAAHHHLARFCALGQQSRPCGRLALASPTLVLAQHGPTDGIIFSLESRNEVAVEKFFPQWNPPPNPNQIMIPFESVGLEIKSSSCVRSPTQNPNNWKPPEHEFQNWSPKTIAPPACRCCAIVALPAPHRLHVELADIMLCPFDDIMLRHTDSTPWNSHSLTPKVKVTVPPLHVSF
jgi:hypothetical protein